VVSRRPNDTQAAVTREADRWQAQYFHDEIHHQIELLNEQAAIFHAELAKYLQRGERTQARRIQRELRLSAVERRELIDMLSALNNRFLSDETNRPVSNLRRRTPGPLASLGLATQRRAAAAPVP
jgi:hypothetical protein